MSEEERKVLAQWLQDKSTLDNPTIKKYLPKDAEGKYLEDVSNVLAPLNILNPYNYLKWTYDNNKEQQKEEPKDNQDINIIWDKNLKDFVQEEKEWIIDKLIPTKSVVIVTGKRGTLKTFITLLMSYSIASEKDFLDKFSTRKGGVIYLDKENGIGIMKKRTEMIKNGMGLNGEDLKVGFICFSQLKLDKLGSIIAIEKLIEEHKPTLLVIDTYRRAVSFDENDAKNVSTLFVDTLRPLVEKYDISILLIHHDRKSSGRDNVDEMDEMRGSSDLANYADVILKMELKTGNLLLKQLKNRNAEEEKPIKIKCNFAEDLPPYVKFSYEGEYLRLGKAEKCAEDIILWIGEKEITQFKTSSVRALALDKGYKKNSLHNALILLQEKGIIELKDRGEYYVKEV